MRRREEVELEFFLFAGRFLGSKSRDALKLLKKLLNL